MAAVGARLHRTGTVFSRINDLVKSGVLAYDDRPLWLDVYKAFPPIREPKFLPDPEPDELGLVSVVDDVRPILYEEDWARATFTALNKSKFEAPFLMLQHDPTNMVKPDVPPVTKFVSLYVDFRKSHPDSTNEEVYQKTLKKFAKNIKENNKALKDQMKSTDS